MVHVAPPNLESAIGTSKLALQYIDEKRYDVARIVIENVIKELENPFFGKEYYDPPRGVITTTEGEVIQCQADR
jgi:hypothetical protein